MKRFDKYEQFGDYHWKLFREQPKSQYANHARFCARWVKERPCLDIGCGDGLITSLLAAEAGPVTGLEISPVALRLAKEHGIPAQLGDVYSLPDLQLSSVFMGDVIEHLEFPMLALAQVAKSLELGGILYLSTPPSRTEPPSPYHFTEYSPDDFKTLLERAGFKIEEFMLKMEWVEMVRQVQLPERSMMFTCITNWYDRDRTDNCIQISAQMASRVPKILSHFFLQETSLWLDGNIYFIGEKELLIEQWLDGYDLAVFAHPFRKTVKEEADELILTKVETKDRVQKFFTAYPEASGLSLFECGVILRKHNEAVTRFNEKWWQLYYQFSCRDQMTFPLAVHLTKGLRVNRIVTYDVRHHPWFRLRDHLPISLVCKQLAKLLFVSK